MTSFQKSSVFRVLAALALTGLVSACSGHGMTPGANSGNAAGFAIPNTPKSISPADIPVKPMAKPPDVPMNTIKPMDAIGPPNWQPIPGTGTFIATSPDGSIWALSDQPAGSDKYIYHYVNGVWRQAAGTASRLAVAPDNTLYAINSGGGAYKYNAGTDSFSPLGGGCSDITVAKDGSVYVLSNGAAPGSDQAIWHYINGTWTQAPGSGVRIAGNWDTQTYTINNGGGIVAPGGFYVLNSAGSIYYENTSGAFALLPGKASAIAPTSNAGLFVLAFPTVAGGTTIFYFDLDAQSYSQPFGSAVNIATNTLNVYAVSSSNGLFYSVNSTTGSLPTYFVNNSGITPAYFTIIGNNPNDRSDPAFYHVTSTGQLVKFAQADRDAQGFADYNIPFPAPGVAFPLPLTRGARMYVSLGVKFKTKINPDLTWASPNGWSDATDANFNTLWDNFEYDYLIGPDSHQPGMGINTTQVQMFGIPLSFSMTGSTGTEQMGFKPGSRTAIFNALTATPPFDSLIVPGTATNTSVSPLRAISADQAIVNGQLNVPNVPHFSNTTYWDTYITNVWNFYKSHTLTANTSAFGTYSGTVNASNQLVFTQANKPDVAFNKPPSTDAIIGNGALITPCNQWPQGSPLFIACAELGSELSAYINRSTLLVDQVMNRNNPCPLSAINEFYQNAPVNVYAQLMHQYSYPITDAFRYAPNGAAYGFGFDDNCNQSSVLIDNNNPSSMTITVQSF